MINLNLAIFNLTLIWQISERLFQSINAYFILIFDHTKFYAIDVWQLLMVFVHFLKLFLTYLFNEQVFNRFFL